jgi:hypothetical protein
MVLFSPAFLTCAVIAVKRKMRMQIVLFVHPTSENLPKAFQMLTTPTPALFVGFLVS